jgi:hypothetical protein
MTPKDHDRYAEAIRKQPHVHWTCFDCRKMFRTPRNERTPRQRAKCPQCGGAMVNIGTYFEPPKQSDRLLWELLKSLVETGYHFKTEGSRAFLYGKWSEGRKPSKRTVIRRIREMLNGRAEP